MGRELMRIGAPFRQPEWSALALTDGPHRVVEAHSNFIDAGAQVITTNSYAIVPFHIGAERFEAEAVGLADLAGRLARQAADSALAANVIVRVAGSLPPLFGSYRPDLFDVSRASVIIDPLVEGLQPHVDLWLAETLSSIAEAQAVRAALDRFNSAIPLWISYTLADHGDGLLRSGETVADAVSAALDLGAVAVLFNCSQAESITAAIEIAIDATRAATDSGSEVEIGGYANRFVAAHTETAEANEQITRLRDDLDPVSYGEFVEAWLDIGATVVGGCCGMEPAHIARIAQLVAQR